MGWGEPLTAAGANARLDRINELEGKVAQMSDGIWVDGKRYEETFDDDEVLFTLRLKEWT